MKILWVLLGLICCLSTDAQSLPEIVNKDSLIYFRGINNMFTIKLNNADPSLVKMKAGSSTVLKVNDTTFQVNNRRDAELVEIKIKLYYKNLPIDLAVLPVENLPPVEAVLNEGLVSGKISMGELFKQKVLINTGHKSLKNQGLTVQSAMVKSDINGRLMPLINLTGNDLSRISRIKNRIKSGSKLVIDSYRIRNKFGQYVRVNVKPLTIIIE